MTRPLAPNGGELVKRLRELTGCGSFFGDDTAIAKAADRIEALERELAEANERITVLEDEESCHDEELREWEVQHAAEMLRATAAELTVTALRERLEGMEAALRGLLQHACIADAAPEDVDEEDRALERAARAILAKGPGQ